MNMHRWNDIRARVRQWTFPRAFRLGWSAPFDPLGRLVASGGGNAPPPPGPAASQGEERDFLVGLGQNLFRIRQNVEGLGEGSKEARSLRRHVGRIFELLERRDVRVLDLTCQTYDPNRLDFEPLAAAEIRPDLERETIILCDSPAILIGGRVVQPAKGLVGAPPPLAGEGSAGAH